MEKRYGVKNTRYVAKSCLYWLFWMAVYTGMFFISISAGVSAIVFTGIGFMCGYMHKSLKVMQKFFDEVAENKEVLAGGKILEIHQNDNPNLITVQVKDMPKKGSKKKGE